MQPIDTETVKVEGSLDGQRVAMRFDENAMVHLMHVLTDMYSDQELAVIREYSTNAWDAHVEAGNTRPIEVSTPTALSPYFRVKDYGVGLSVDDIINVYSAYGASTKRETDDQAGMLGIGCKSALTYCAQFNVIGIKNGVKTQVAVSREGDGLPVMNIVDTVSTHEPNGVEIVVPTKNLNQFESKAKHFFSFWQPGRVLLNGKEAAGFENAKKLSDTLYVTKESSQDYIVMGQIAYPVSGLTGDGGYYRDYGVVAFVEMGAVHFTPSRESLNMTDRTKRRIQQIVDEYKATLHTVIQDEINSAVSHAEALQTFYTWHRVLGSSLRPNTFKYHAETLPTGFTGRFMLYTPNGYYRQKAVTHRQIGWEEVGNSLVVHGFDSENLTTPNRQKLIKYAEDNDLDYDKFLLCDVPPGAPWTDNATTVDFEDIRAVELPKKATNAYGGPKKVREKYEIIDSSGYREQSNEFDDSGDVFYISPREFDEDAGYYLRSALPDATIVVIGKNRFAKFLRDYPQAKHARESVKQAHLDAVAALTRYDRLYIYREYGRGEDVKGFDPTKIDDPDVVSYIEDVKNIKSSTRTERYERTKIAMYRLDLTPSAPAREKLVSPMDKYPLAVRQSYGTTKWDHIYLYMNAVYAQKESK